MTSTQLIDSLIKLYHRPNIESDYIENNQSVVIFAHCDRVGIIIQDRLSQGIYKIKIYGTIDFEYLSTLKKFHHHEFGPVTGVLFKNNKGDHCMQFEKDLPYNLNDFLGYLPDYEINNGLLCGPYLDNLLGIYIASVLLSKYAFGLIQCKDEEIGGRTLLQYDYSNSKIGIIIDVISQEYVDEELNYDFVYAVRSTKFRKFLLPNSKLCQPIDIRVKFKTEGDIIGVDNLYYILLPVKHMHKEISECSIGIIQKAIEVLSKLIV